MKIILTTKNYGDALIPKEIKELIQDYISNARWISYNLNHCTHDKYTIFVDNKFLYKEIISSGIDKEEGLLLIIRMLKNLVVDYYSNEFEKEFGGYFNSISNMSIDECISIYFTIDFIEKDNLRYTGLFTYYLYKYNSRFREESEYSMLKAFYNAIERISNYEKETELLQFEKRLLKTESSLIDNEHEKITIDDIDLMNGREFEEYVFELFRKMGYTATLTSTTGDQGIDIIAAKNGITIGVQTKCYLNNVTNKAVQEVVAGINYYNLSKAVVITNNWFTKSAKELAISNDVVLWDRNILKEKTKMF